MYEETMVPENESCINGLIPKRDAPLKVKIATDLVTAPKLFFKANRLMLYRYLNEARRKGWLRGKVGFDFTNTSINKSVCDFTGWDFWRISQKNFYTVVYFTLTLNAKDGPREWKGYLEVWCGFDQEFACSVEDMGSQDNLPDHSEDIRLSPFLVPYMHGYEWDEACEKIWRSFNSKAIMDPKARDAEKLAEHYGLSVQYLPVYDAPGTGSILFFAGNDLLVKEQKERFQDEKAKKEDDIRNPPESVFIPANTIVVNTNNTDKEHAAFNIFHEIIHYEYHYLFFRLQDLCNNDVRMIKMKEITIKPEERVMDPIYWMEKQANRGAYGLIMPITWMREEVGNEWKRIERYRHMGELFDIIGRRICARNKLPNYQMRARLIQMGHLEAKGSLNWLTGGIRVEPFAFELENCQKIEETFVIDNYVAGRLYEKDEGFRRIFDEGKFIWADGHIVRNDSRFVRGRGRGMKLTPWANAHVDQCCLRFEKIYIQGGPGRYIFGRMNFDADYVTRTNFFLEDYLNQGILNEMEAEKKFADAFPSSINDGLKLLMQRENISQEKMAELLDVDDRTFKYWLSNDDKRYTEDFIMIFSLTLKLPDWISNLLFDRAGITLGEKNPRGLALRWIQRNMWDQGVEKANEYLTQRKYKPLKIVSRKKTREPMEVAS